MVSAIVSGDKIPENSKFITREYMWWAGYFYSGCTGRGKDLLQYILCKITSKPVEKIRNSFFVSHVWFKIICPGYVLCITYQISPLYLCTLFCFRIIYSGYFYSGCKGREISPSFTYFVGFYAKPVILSLVCCVPLLIEKVWDCDSRNDGWSVWQ